MISRTVRYAFHILGELAGQPGERVRGEELARATGVPSNYLSKILNQLRKAGIVDSQKGWGGGFRLRPDAVGRPIRDVMAALEGTASIEERDCAFGLPRCSDDRPCPLHDQWAGVRGSVQTMLDRTTIGDLAGTDG